MTLIVNDMHHKIQLLKMQYKAHGAEKPKQYVLYDEAASTAQRCNAIKKWILK